MKNDDFWAGSFGQDYHERNRVNWRGRVPFWQSAIDYTEAHSVLEVGCGPGWNLLAIESVKPSAELNGVDVHAGAAEEARQQGIEAHASNALGIMSLYEPGSIDLVFTAGMLIHVAPEDLEATMRAIITTSGRYVLAIEYAADQEEEVEYRGHAGKLWRRPFGKLYQEMGLTLVAEVPEAEGFDNCTAWLFTKGA